MLISVGLPSTYPGISGEQLLDWARKADQGPFESLCVLDVITSPAYESIIALTAAAAVTHRIRLMTTILVGTLRNPTLLAKQALSLNALSGGRFTLGLGAGYREKDFQACEIDFHQRGKKMENLLETITKIWDGQSLGDGLDPVGPNFLPGPRLILGGGAPVAMKRIGRYGEGYIGASVPPEGALENYAIAEAAWKETGRPGKPRLINMNYFAFGPDAKKLAAEHLHIYYHDFPEVEQHFLNVLSDNDEAVRDLIKANE